MNNQDFSEIPKCNKEKSLVQISLNAILFLPVEIKSLIE
jgi:hypothetical protein